MFLFGIHSPLFIPRAYQQCSDQKFRLDNKHLNLENWCWSIERIQDMGNDIMFQCWFMLNAI